MLLHVLFDLLKDPICVRPLAVTLSQSVDKTVVIRLCTICSVLYHMSVQICTLHSLIDLFGPTSTRTKVGATTAGLRAGQHTRTIGSALVLGDHKNTGTLLGGLMVGVGCM